MDMDNNYDELPDNYDELPILHDDDNNSAYAASGFISPTKPLTISQLQSNVTVALNHTKSIIPLISFSKSYTMVIQMTSIALSRIEEYFVPKIDPIEMPPLSGSRLRVSNEVTVPSSDHILRWKRTADINASSDGSTATWNSKIHDIHWCSTKCTSRLHNGSYLLELHCQTTPKLRHIRIGFLLEYLASTGRKHVDWGQDGEYSKRRERASRIWKAL